jgi:quinone-modifying oxidoreductase, subunit QmoC
MTQRVDSSLLQELKQYGHINVEACFNCGNCTAVCPLSTDSTPFPRNNIRMLQLGLKDRMLTSVDPWLCYYCGDCTATCPKGAEPAEAQMTMRRWLTAQYSIFGVAKRFYTSAWWTYGGVLVTMILVALGFILFHGPMLTDRVAMNVFAPVHTIHTLDTIWSLIVGFFVVSGVIRMWNLIIRKGSSVPIPISAYATELWKLPYHFATQRRWMTCSEEEKENRWTKAMPWFSHLLLVTGYVTMFILIVALLPWFQSDEMRPIFHPQRILGYYAAAVLIFGGGRALWGRITKGEEYHRYSEPSDWLLPGLLFGLAVTGMFISLFKYMQLPIPVYYMYVIHLMVMLPLYVTVGPMGKWSHMYYRPLAVYFQAVMERARVVQAERAAAAAAA